MKIIFYTITLSILLGFLMMTTPHDIVAQPSFTGPPVFLLLNNADVPPTANEYVPPYTGSFQYGLNPGYYGNNWNDKDIYQLCFDAGCRSARNTLPDHFIATWGVTVRKDTFEHITTTLDFKQITTFLQGPRPDWQDGKLWQGMYQPIWDEGQNGTPVNDANRFALYVWQVVNTYADYISFYEIINEPDYTSGNNGWRESGVAGNWWDAPPPPAELNNLLAPVFSYIRLLRIAYAVISKYDPGAYITPGGLGYRSFLDALLRYTDNPDGGKVTKAYPLTGGAYFNALSIHNYPQFRTREWDGAMWQPKRYSDKATEVFILSKQEFEEVLISRGYNGLTYPQKPFIVTEINVARKQIGETLGGEELQRNFTIKALVKAQQNNIKQIYWFATGEGADYATATNSFSLMGFYEQLSTTTPSNQIMTDQAIANRTTYEQLYGWNFDKTATLALNLPASIDGTAFKKDGNLRYVLWAKTSIDQSESASATITLPGNYHKTTWNGIVSSINGTNITLTGAPVFLSLQ